MLPITTEADTSENQANHSVSLGKRNPLTANEDADHKIFRLHWRRQLHRLAALDLPLLAVGAGPERKAPANLRNGELLTGWTTAKHTPSQLHDAHKKVIAAGTRTGKDAHGLIAFDIDGETAVSWCLEHGCDPTTTATWQIHRNTDESRLKVAFRLSEDQQQQLGQLKTKVETKPPVKDAAGKVIAKGQAVELFHGSGQVIVLGQHWPSKGYYLWPEGMGPEALAPIPQIWWDGALAIADDTTPRAATPTARSTGKGDWRSLNPCTICGRDTTGFCSQHKDGKTIRCFHGNTFSPPTGLRRGDEIPDKQGTIWAYSKTEVQKDGNVFSVFVEPDPERRCKVIPIRSKRTKEQQEHNTALEQLPLDAPFRILGWGTKLDAIWVQTGQTGVVASIPPSKNGLQRIAGLTYWDTLYPSKSGPDWDRAISSICEQAHDLRQTFTPDRIRGCGVWLDNNRVVWHLGNRLEVDGQHVELTQLQGTSWTYASLPMLDIRPDEQLLTDEEGAAVLDLIHKQMQWTNPGDGLLIAGSIVLGNICGALDLRPGLQLTGPSQAGKSTVERRIIRPLQGGLGVRPSGATEAGIRQKMQANALPVVIDESEGEAAKQREGHLRLLRLSFDGQELIRGTAGGQALTYTMRSSITLIGINAAVPNLADRNRLVVVRPRKMPPEQWADFMLNRDALITVKTGQRLIRRSVTNLKALLANISTFQAVIASTGLVDRAAEVYGSLLAGAHHMTSTAVLEPRQALAWLDSVGWSGLDEETKEAIASDAEGRACLDHLLGHPVHWKESETGSVDVRELLTIVITSANSDDAKKALGRLGMKFDIALGLVVSNGTRIFTSTRWANGAHRDRLLEIEGADRVSGAVWFAGGGAHKAVFVPVKDLELTPLDA